MIGLASVPKRSRGPPSRATPISSCGSGRDRLIRITILIITSSSIITTIIGWVSYKSETYTELRTQDDAKTDITEAYQIY